MISDQNISSVIDISSDMKQLCEKSLRMLNISYFSYTKVNKDATFTTLTSDHVWTKNFYLKEYYNIGVDSLMPQEDAFGNYQTIVWEMSERDKNHEVILTDLQAHGIYNLCTLIKMTKDETYLYHFGSDNMKLSQNQIYFDNQELLKIFTYYFHEQLHKSHKLQAVAETYFHLNVTLKESSIIKNKSLAQSFQNTLNIERYYVNEKYYITKRELECIQWISLGKTVEDIGVILNISSRTVEAHVNNLKQKLDCYKVTSAIHKLTKLGLIS